jgi:protein TonB
LTPETDYVGLASKAGVEGCIVVKCVITTEGIPRDCQAVEALPPATEAAIASFRLHRFKPATCDGKPVEMDYTFRVTVWMP